MWRDHFLITRDWLLDEMPLLDISKHTLYRKLRHLREMGLLSVLHRGGGKIKGTMSRTLAYWKLTPKYWRTKAKIHAVASKSVEAYRAQDKPFLASQKCNSRYARVTSKASITDAISAEEQPALTAAASTAAPEPEEDVPCPACEAPLKASWHSCPKCKVHFKDGGHSVPVKAYALLQEPRQRLIQGRMTQSDGDLPHDWQSLPEDDDDKNRIGR